MTGQDVYEVFAERGGKKLYHANSVKTSVSLLSLGGLASRGVVEDNNLPQTVQISDQDDRKYGIWYDSFVDTHDIHQTLRRRNFYGPVVFEMDARLLLRLPKDATVMVTRCNPTKWHGLSDNERYFMTARELEEGFRIGFFDHMITIRSPRNVIQFGNSLERIILDEPRLSAPNVGEEFMTASRAIAEAAAKMGSQVRVERRVCDNCICRGQYQDPKKPSRIPHFFSP